MEEQFCWVLSWCICIYSSIIVDCTKIQRESLIKYNGLEVCDAIFDLLPLSRWPLWPEMHIHYRSTHLLGCCPLTTQSNRKNKSQMINTFAQDIKYCFINALLLISSNDQSEINVYFPSTIWPESSVSLSLRSVMCESHGFVEKGCEPGPHSRKWNL